MRKLILALAAALVLAPSAFGATIRVPAQQPTIQAGINAAAPGDTVLVAPGTFTGPGNRDLDFGGKSLAVRSSGGAAQTVIDCQNVGRGFNFHTGETNAALVEGFTIRNGTAGPFFGGGVSANGASPTIRSCIFQLNRGNTGGGLFLANSSTAIAGCSFTANMADNWGGALYAEGSTLAISNSAFSQNSAGFGAGAYLTLGSSTTLADCSFTENTPANLAGGIHCESSALALTRCSFTQNTGRRGAGVYCLGGSSASLDSCTFASNTATLLGAGIYAETISSLSVDGCTFTGNETTTGPGTGAGGAGIYTEDVDNFAAVGSVFTGNAARGTNGIGGGLYIRLAYQGQGLVSGCTFSGNHAEYLGGGANLSSRVDVIDCLFRDNEAGEEGGGLSDAQNLTGCTFIGNHAGTRGGGFVGGSTESSMFTMADCVFMGNTAVIRGGGVNLVGGTLDPASLNNCLFYRNSAATGGGLYVIRNWTATFSQCTLAENSAVQGGAIYVADRQSPPRITLDRCTLVENTASFGAGLHLYEPVTIQNTIIAHSTNGEAVYCAAANAVPVLSCTDIFGNAGGDWTACISDQLGINGCFAADPRFCNLGGGDYTLAATSPCAPANAPAGCGLIGAHPVGCAVPIGVADEEAPALDPVLRVQPNPVSEPGTTVEWSQAARGPAVARVYDVAGRLLLCRDLGVRGPGLERARWSEVTGGARLGAGVYFLGLDGAGSASIPRRVVLVP